MPDAQWEIVEPLLPRFEPRRQGGGTAPVDMRAVFTAIVFVLTSGCAWRHLAPSFEASPATAHRRFTAWTEAGVWPRLHRAVLDRLGAAGEIDWSRRSWTPPASGRKGELVDRPEPGRPRQARAGDALTDLDDLPVLRWPSADAPRRRAFGVRGTLTAYDAAYVALAEALGCTLVTRDIRLARAGGHGARVSGRRVTGDGRATSGQSPAPTAWSTTCTSCFMRSSCTRGEAEPGPSSGSS